MFLSCRIHIQVVSISFAVISLHVRFMLQSLPVMFHSFPFCIDVLSFLVIVHLSVSFRFAFISK